MFKIRRQSAIFTGVRAKSRPALCQSARPLPLLLLAFLLLAFAASARADDGKISRPDGVELYYHTVGTGEPLILLSGGPGSNVDILKPVADELGKDYQCVLLEQRGTGRSHLRAYNTTTVNLNLYIDDLDALREHLKQDKLTLLGNSWGMMLALAYASAHPDRVRAIVTMGSGPITSEYFTAFSDNIRARLWPVDREAQQRAGRARDHATAAFEELRAILPGYFYDHDLGERYAQALTPDGFNPEVNPPVMGALARAHFDLRPSLRKVSAPVLLIQGRQDPAGEANLYEAHLALSGSRLEFLEKCGHLPWVEQPTQFYRSCRQFLSEVYPVRAAERSGDRTDRREPSASLRDHANNGSTHAVNSSPFRFRK